jgi:hypothetical protein
MNTHCSAETTTIDDLIQRAFAAGVVVPMPIERNGIIIGGLLVIQGETNYERVKAAFAPGGPRTVPVRSSNSNTATP